MSTLVDFPRPAHPERVGLTRYQDLERRHRSLNHLTTTLDRKIKDTQSVLWDWRTSRDARLGLREKMFRKKKWQAMRESEQGISLALSYKGHQYTYFFENDLLGRRWLDKCGWSSGDEGVYYDISAQIRNFERAVLMPLKRFVDTGAMEIPVEERLRLITSIVGIYQAVSDALAEYFVRLRPRWSPPDPKSLPSPFCPLALAIQSDRNYSVNPVVRPHGSLDRQCTQCLAVSEGALGDPLIKGKDNPWRAAFLGHLRAKEPGEKVKHACPGCLKVFDDWKKLDSHLWEMWWEDWHCDQVPMRLQPAVINSVAYYMR